MAQKKKIIIDIPELDRAKDSNSLTTGRCRLTLETDKSYRSGVDCTAQVSWVDERGFGGFVLGIGGGGDFYRTYAKIAGAATQKRIDTLHADTFTPEFIESIKSEVRTFYAPNPEKERQERARRENQAAMGAAVKELTDSGIDASTALRMLNID